MFEGLRILRPATWTIWDETRPLVSERCYWTWLVDPEARRCRGAASDEELVDELD